MRGKATLQHDTSLARYTSWRVGGDAKQIFRPNNVQALQTFLKTLPDQEPIYWLGLGSNMLVRDGGVNGTVIITQGGLDDLFLTDQGIVAQAGVSCAKLARFAAKQSSSEVAFLAGVPGTVGGALRMNAGAYGGETWAYVRRVETIDRQGRIKQRLASEFEIGYRSVKGLNESEWFLSSTFVFPSGDAEQALRAIKALLSVRGKSQPIGFFSGGSTFRNPPGDYAGRLIEQCGLKGHRIGGACISEKHANFIVNDETAKASDIEGLIQHVQQCVAEQTGIRLMPEVCIIGEQSE